MVKNTNVHRFSPMFLYSGGYGRDIQQKLPTHGRLFGNKPSRKTFIGTDWYHKVHFLVFIGVTIHSLSSTWLHYFGSTLDRCVAPFHFHPASSISLRIPPRLRNTIVTNILLLPVLSVNFASHFSLCFDHHERTVCGLGLCTTCPASSSLPILDRLFPIVCFIRIVD
jgi:hypothetical protein